jgi:hypothetical protein
MARIAGSTRCAASGTNDRRALIERLDRNTWQYEAVGTLQNVLRLVQPTTPGTPVKVALRAWFASFAELRNKTRGHGAPRADTCAKGIPDLEKSIQLLCANNPVFQRPWAHLHRNLSGRYRIVQIGGDRSAFSKLAVNGKRYELHSLITDNRMEGDASPYLPSASDRPPSETQGLDRMFAVCWRPAPR